MYSVDQRAQRRRSSTVPRPPPPLPLAEPLKYYLGSGNNSSLVRRVLALRPQWSEVSDSKDIFINLRWQQSNKSFKYDNCIEHRVYKHALNHFEHHYELSNKELLFRNVHQYCLNNNTNPFDIMPLTFVLNLSSGCFQQDLKQF